MFPSPFNTFFFFFVWATETVELTHSLSRCSMFLHCQQWKPKVTTVSCNNVLLTTKAPKAFEIHIQDRLDSGCNISFTLQLCIHYPYRNVQLEARLFQVVRHCLDFRLIRGFTVLSPLLLFPCHVWQLLHLPLILLTLGFRQFNEPDWR